VANLPDVASVWDSIKGQERAITALRGASTSGAHSFLLVGPEGCGREEAARALAAFILLGTDDAADERVRLVMRGIHTDLEEVRRDGASIRVEQVEEVIEHAPLAAREGPHKVVILHEIDLMAPAQVVRLLKTVEEPPTGVHFILLADQITDLLVTLASRSLVVHFAELSAESVSSMLVAEGVPAEAAAEAARAAHGNLGAARLLASDPRGGERREFFADIPTHLDGTGATAAGIVDRILAVLDEVVEPLKEHHAREVADLEASWAAMGVKRSPKKALDDRHKREIRRHRTDALRSGLTEIAGVYRDELVRNDHLNRADTYVAAIERIHDAMRRLSLSANESMLLRDLVWSLPSPDADARLQHALAERA
jgi:DNA polymerase-3 subunit delta'